MRTRAFFFCFAATALLASCSVEPAVPENVIPDGITEIRVGLADTKTVLGDKEGSNRKVYWADGDKIAVNGVESAALSGVADKSTSAVFTLIQAVSTPLNVLYPAEMYKDADVVKLPATQDYVAGSFASGALPMAGSGSSVSEVSLKHLCAVMKLSILKGTDSDAIQSVSFKGNAGEQVSGEFYLDYNSGTLGNKSASAADQTVTMNSIYETLSTSEPLEIYLVVPAREYASGFTVTITDEAGHMMTKSYTQSKELVAGKIYLAGEFAFTPSGEDPTVNIASASDLVTFAQKYNAGDYEALGDDLVVNFTSDISFDASTSAAFNATGGIATSDVHFHGTVNGNNKTIKNFTASVPLWVATGGGCVIKDLTIDNSCVYTFVHGNEAEGRFGALVGYNKAEVSNVTVNATIGMADAEVAQATYIGGIAGRSTTGSFKDCTFGGKLVLSDGFIANDKKIIAGGIVGYVSNESGVVQSCTFSGTIDNQAKMVASSETSDFKSNPQLIIGGIVGFNNGTVDNCNTMDDATGVSVTVNDGSDHTYTGTLVNHTVNAYHYSFAGIAGRNEGTVNSCANQAKIVNMFHGDRGTSGNMNGRYLNVAGIVGYNGAEAVVSGCNNSGSIIDRATPKMHYVGGIVGRNYGTVSQCENVSTATIGVGTAHIKPYSARMLYLGGAIGSNEAGATAGNLSNAAKLNISRIETTTGYAIHIGGVIGKNQSPLTTGSYVNTGDIAESNGVGKCSTPTASNDYGFFIGGVAGYSTEAMTGASNSGKVSYTCAAKSKVSDMVGIQYVYLGGVVGKLVAAETVDVSGCTNSGNVTFTASDKCSEDGHAGDDDDPHVVAYDYIYMGGVAGYAKNAAFKSNCSNSGVIKGGDGSANNKRSVPSFTMGGIAGYIGGTSSITKCTLTGSGQVYNDHFSNRGIGSYDCPVTGGIAGFVDGADGALISISNCSVGNQASVVSRRGAVGGIVALAKYATISGCTYPNAIGSQSGYFYGGIVAGAQYTTVNSCTFNGDSIKSSQIQIGGGIIGKLDTGSMVSGCSSYVTAISKSDDTAITSAGGIAGQSVKETTIKNSHYKSGIAICGDAEFTDGGGNAADL